MSERPQLDWRVPEEEWSHFRSYVEDQFGRIDGYLGRETELAMMEYADADGYEGVEQKVDRLVRAAGRTPKQVADKKISASLEGQDTTRVMARVAENIKNEFKAVAREGDASFGVALARAVRTYRQGGRAARLEQKVDRIVDDAEGLLSMLDGGAEDGDLSAKERKIAIIKNRLGDQFEDATLNDEIHDVVGEGPRASDPTLKQYREVIIDDLGHEPHPGVEQNKNDTRVWVPAHTAEELAPEGVPRACRLPAEMLDADQKVRRIRMALGKAASERTSGQYQQPAEFVEETILEGAVASGELPELLNDVALEPGFSLGKTNRVVVATDLENVNDGLLADIIAYRDGSDHTVLRNAGETQMSDWVTTDDGADDGAEDADTETESSADTSAAPASSDTATAEADSEIDTLSAATETVANSKGDSGPDTADTTPSPGTARTDDGNTATADGGRGSLSGRTDDDPDDDTSDTE